MGIKKLLSKTTTGCFYLIYYLKAVNRRETISMVVKVKAIPDVKIKAIPNLLTKLIMKY